MKANIGVDADSALVYTVICTSGNVAEVTQANSLLHGEEVDGSGDAGYQGDTSYIFVMQVFVSKGALLMETESKTSSLA